MSQKHDENRSDLVPVEENGKTYWRSLNHVAETTEFKEFLDNEFPAGASELNDPVSRRSFLQLAGASVALAGFGAGCVRRAEEHVLPYARRPEDLIPGLPQFYATTMVAGDMVTGLVVEAHEGRPTKIEGNKLHPASMGGACSFEQGAILSLYDPDRTSSVVSEGNPSGWAEADAALAAARTAAQANGGAGLMVIHESTQSPTFARVREELRATFPNAKVIEWEAVSNDAVLEGTRLAFGEAFEPVLRLERADSILAVDTDLFGAGPFHLRYSRDWASRRAPDAPGGMNRLWSVEPVFTVTGASADHRMRIRSSEAGAFLKALAASLASAGVDVPAGIAAAGDRFDPKFMSALARELAGKRGRSLIAIGRHQPAEVQAIAHALNEALGNNGSTVRYARPATAREISHVDGIRQAAQALSAGQVETLVLLGGNPAYDAPVDLDFGAAMEKAKSRIHLTGSPNETSAKAQWVLPETHFLEAWGDAAALDGSYSIVQPLILPIWNGRSKIELLSQLASGKAAKGHDLVRATFAGGRGDDAAWRKTLHDGVLEGSANQFADVAFDAAGADAAARKVSSPAAASSQALDLVYLVDNKVYDGRFANNGWLQELPDPMTKLTWTNAALIGPATAKELGLKTGDVVNLSVAGRTVKAPIWIQPGTAENTVGIALGYGRTEAGRVGNGQGANVYALRGSDALWTVSGLQVSKTAGSWILPATQDHHSMEGRPIVREAKLADYQADPLFARKMVVHPPLVELWKQHEYVGQQWGMSIDLNSCVGCNGCMIACQAENNIPVVGPEETRMGREMHWIRLDRYFASANPDDVTDLSDAEVVFQPLTCMQCENAPCENVCPVAATVHSKDGGLNDMVYNRCIGTRYCSNNCPYKVRRFNFLDWHIEGASKLTDVEKMKFNPDVTVRTRGVMEKCTYCVQRINSAKRDAKVSGLEKVPDGAITPACAQACPTDAIVFGDISDPNSRVSKLKQQPRNYEVLGELNTKPRTSYLARIRNPNPELVS